MGLFLVLSTLYLLFINLTIVLVDFKERNIFFWGLVTIIFMLCLGDSERKKDKKVTIALMELEALSNVENNHCLSRYRDLIITRRLKAVKTQNLE